MPGTFAAEDVPLKTPETAGRLQPARFEMHPSKAQQSTAKTPDSGLRLGFTDISESMDAAVRAIESTPSKSNMPGSPGFNFKWNRPDSDLSAEAQRIMESVRGEAAKIKEKMQFERSQQAVKDEEADQMTNITGRKMAKVRSKAGRFSDVHKAEFKKMDSIANHVSVWKNKLQSSSSQVNLKRTKSRADLNEGGKGHIEEAEGRPNPPGKRVKIHANEDVSGARPTSSGSMMRIQTPRSHIKTNSLPSGATTPTKASLARAASVKSMRTTKLPTLNRSKSTKELASRAAPRTEGSNKYFSALARAPSMKSILHRAEPKFSDGPTKIAAETHLPKLKGVIAAGKESSTMPGLCDIDSTLQQTPTAKRVGFNVAAESESESAVNSPSPSKIPSRPNGLGQSPTRLRDVISYPSLPKHVAGPLSSNPPGPGDFTFRSNKPMNSGPASSGLKLPTIRQVRPSGVATPISAFDSLPTVPHGVPNKKRRRVDEDDGDRENFAQPKDTTFSSPAKKQKMQRNFGATLMNTSSPRKSVPGSKTPDPKARKGGLSLSRLNMLARPKARR